MPPHSTLYLHASQALSAPNLQSVDSIGRTESVGRTGRQDDHSNRLLIQNRFTSGKTRENRIPISSWSARGNVYGYPEQAFGQTRDSWVASVAGSSPASQLSSTLITHGGRGGGAGGGYRQTSLYGSSSSGTLESSTTLSLPPQRTPLSALNYNRVKTLSQVFLSPSLTVDSGVDGVQEWVSYWSERGSRLRELVEEAQDVVQGITVSRFSRSGET